MTHPPLQKGRSLHMPRLHSSTDGPALVLRNLFWKFSRTPPLFFSGGIMDPCHVECNRTRSLVNEGRFLLRLRWLAIHSGRFKATLAVTGAHTALDVETDRGARPRRPDGL